MWKLFALVIITVAGISALIDRRRERPTVSFHGRDPVSDADFGKCFFPDCADLAVALRRIMAEKRGVDMSRLQPDDPLGAEELIGDGLDGVEYLMNVEDSFKITIPDEESESLRSFGDLVSCVDRLVRERNAA